MPSSFPANSWAERFVCIAASCLDATGYTTRARRCTRCLLYRDTERSLRSGFLIFRGTEMIRCCIAPQHCCYRRAQARSLWLLFYWPRHVRGPLWLIRRNATPLAKRDAPAATVEPSFLTPNQTATRTM